MQELEPQVQQPVPKLSQEPEGVVACVIGVQIGDVFQELHQKIIFFQVVGFFFRADMELYNDFLKDILEGARHIGKHLISILLLDVWQTCNKHNHSMITSH